MGEWIVMSRVNIESLQTSLPQVAALVSCNSHIYVQAGKVLKHDGDGV